MLYKNTIDANYLVTNIQEFLYNYDQTHSIYVKFMNEATTYNLSTTFSNLKQNVARIQIKIMIMW